MTTLATDRRIELAIGGMTCATCANRIERKLNRMDGVIATVNYATETASVRYPDRVNVDDLVATVAATGYTATPPAGAPPKDIDPGRRLLVSALLSVPVIVLAMVSPLQFDGWQWVALGLATPVVTWGAWPFHRAAWRAARHGMATMDTLISLGAAVSYLWSLAALAFGPAGRIGMHMDFRLLAPRGSAGSAIYLEVGAALTTFLLGGRFIEARAKHRGGTALRALAELGAKDAAVIRGGHEIRVPVAGLAVDDLFLVRPGEKVATDGVVVAGSSAIDASLVTGESVPVDVAAGDHVVGATTNVSGRLTVRATRVGSGTQLAQITRLVTEAQSGKASVQRLADRIAGVFVPIVLFIAAATFVTWLALGYGAAAAVTSAIAVLIVACPCALGLATPTALLVGTGRGAQLGILIRGPQVLESTRRIDTVVLDKTGTVTTGRMAVTAVVSATGDDAEVLRLAAAVEHGSEHPIGAAITLAARIAGRQLPEVSGFRAMTGVGARGTIDGHEVLVGRPNLATASLSPRLATALADADGAGRTAVLVVRDGIAAGVITVADSAKPDAAAAIDRLRRLGLRPMLLTGDSAAAARAIAAEIGIAAGEVIADVMPADKVALVRRLQAGGRVVAMVGDGVNDAAALAAADLGIAMGTGSDVAIEASDLTVVRPDLGAVADAVRLARATYRTIVANLFWAFAYNVAAIPLAAAGLVTPVLAAAAMAASSIFVVLNSLRLARFRTAA